MTRSTTILRAAAVAAALGATVAVPAAAQAPPPTLALDKPCYSPGDVIAFSGNGFTANGGVDVSFSGRALALAKMTADGAGALKTRVPVRDSDVDALLDDDEPNRKILIAAVDVARIEQGDQNAAATVSTRFSRFDVSSNQAADAMEPGRRLRLNVVGFTGQSGNPVFLHYVRGGQRRATVRIGVLSGPCGDVERTLPRAFPRRIVRPGKWTLVFSTSATTPRSGMWFSVPVRIRR
jgi:hypothetical protein